MEVNDSWTTFAKANDAPELSSPGVLGLRLWDAITDPSTRELYRGLLDRVRRGEAITYRYRCDGPAVRRDMQMRVALDAGASDSPVVSITTASVPGVTTP